MTATSQQLIRHILTTMSFRMGHILDGLPDGFGEFDAGHGVRTPTEIVTHMTGMLKRTKQRYAGEAVSASDEDKSWEEAVDAWYEALSNLDATVAEAILPDIDTMLRLLQGPISDCITHLGQLATLRRLAGAPLEPLNYYRQDMSIGDIGRK